MKYTLHTVLVAVCALALSACGGGGGGSSNTTTPTKTANTSANNALSVSVKQGPASFVNRLYATVTICVPGTATCQSIDNVLVDTGSSGLRLLSSAMNSSMVSALTNTTTSSGQAAAECMQFGGGYAWGSVKAADVKLGGETASNIGVEIMGDSSYATIPTACSNTGGANLSSTATLGANGVLGISTFTSDCGDGCVSTSSNGLYYGCNGANCTPDTIALSSQVVNPIAKFATDNNGSVLTLGMPGTLGSSEIDGTLYFGVNTQANNTLSSQKIVTLNASGNFSITINNQASFGLLDTGSQAYYFNTTSMSDCTGKLSGYYCPSTEQTFSATVGSSNTISFSVNNATSLFNSNNYALYNLGIANTLGSNINSMVILGLPFFFGKSVATILQDQVVAGQTGPAIAF